MKINFFLKKSKNSGVFCAHRNNFRCFRGSAHCRASGISTFIVWHIKSFETYLLCYSEFGQNIFLPRFYSGNLSYGCFQGSGKVCCMPSVRACFMCLPSVCCIWGHFGRNLSVSSFSGISACRAEITAWKLRTVDFIHYWYRSSQKKRKILFLKTIFFWARSART